jgi:hypothetical protein
MPSDEEDFHVLYKYRSLSGNSQNHTFRIIAHGKLFYASPRDFNDPFDCQFSVTMREAPLSEKGISKKDELKSFAEQWLRDETNQDTAILSLSEVNNDILMWSHYADCHTGICLQLKIPKSNKLYKVQYSQTRPQFFFADAREQDRDDARFRDAIIGTLTTKSLHWEYEREWRCIDFDGPGERPLPERMLTGIIFGCRTSDLDKEMVKAWIEFRGHPIDLFQAVEKDGEFALEVVEVA